MRVRGGVVAWVSVVASLLVTGAAAPASANAAASYKITVAARVCSEYTDVFANRARNNIQESLRDLGPDSPYVAGSLVSPVVEDDTPPQSDCRPIVGWDAKLGTGIAGSSDNGPWGSLSKVSNPFPRQIRTLATTPLLDATGAPTGRRISGAVTFALNDDELAQAQRNNLWVQGGVPGDPVLNSRFPGRYGFAALRCAVDVLNGDNVEYVGYPSGVTHVFCYAIYVSPPPSAGTIVVRKEADPLASGGTNPVTFPFGGNVSYVPGGGFELVTAPGSSSSIDFVRAQTRPGEDPWRITETPVDGWQLVSLSCTSAKGTSTTTVTGSEASIVLGDADTVTCTYRNRATTPTALEVGKRTIGGVGAFPMTVTAQAGGAVVQRTVRTTKPGVTEFVGTGITTPGNYLVRETLPVATTGRWVADAVVCDAVRRPLSLRAARAAAFAVVLRPGEAPPRCAFVNRFVPYGSITIRGVAWGAPTVKRFLVQGVGDPEFVAEQSVALPVEGVAGTATGDSTRLLELGTYTIQETAPVSSDDGTWTLVDVTCTDDALRSTAAGGVRVRLTADRPHVTCAYTNRFDATPIDPPGPDPDPNPGPGPNPSPEPDPLPGPSPDPDPVPGPPTGGGNETDGAGPNPGQRPGTGAVATGPDAVVPAVFRPWSEAARLIEPGTDVVPAARAGSARSAVRARAALRRAPVLVRIPRLGVRTRPLPLTVTRGGDLRVPGDEHVSGWWTGGARPGSRGVAVVAGHVDGPSGPGVFNRLRVLAPGDAIWVERGQAKVRYTVRRVATTPRWQLAASRVFGTPLGAGPGARVLRIVTCGGSFDDATGHYSSNVVVEAVA